MSFASTDGSPRLLDLFCGAGGAAMGYALAGFDVVGVDLEPQPNYPFEFHRADALSFPLEGFDVVHASPPCQAYSATAALHPGVWHPHLIEPTRARLVDAGVDYVLENVVGAPLVEPVLLCGSMFGLEVRRHRLFEVSRPLLAPSCAHGVWRNRYPTGDGRDERPDTSPVVQVWGTGGGPSKDLELWREAMGTPWMETKAEVAEAVPPAYTEFIGAQLI